MSNIFGSGGTGTGGGVTSIAKFGSSGLTGDVTLSAGSSITLTQTGQDIEVAVDVPSLTIAESQVTNLVSDLANKVATSTTISTTAPLSGGGDLSTNRTITTSMATNKLIGRGTAGTGVMEEITLGTNLSLSGTTLNASGGAGASWSETEIDFGSTPTWDKTFTITDGTVSGSSKIMVLPSGNVGTDRVGNDWEWDSLMLSALAGSGQFTLSALAMPGPVVGKRKVFYTVA